MSNIFNKYRNIISCSFCLRRENDLEFMVSGQYSFICLNCVLVCLKIFFNINYKNKNILNNKNLEYNYNNYYKNKYLKIFNNFNKKNFFNFSQIKRNINFLNSNIPYYNKNKFYNYDVNNNIIKNTFDYLNFNFKNNFIYEKNEKLIYYNDFSKDFIQDFEDNDKNYSKYIFNYVNSIINLSNTYTGNKINKFVFLDDLDGVLDYNESKTEFLIDIIINFQDDYIYKCKNFEFSSRLIPNNKLKKINNNLKKKKKPSKDVIYIFENRFKNICNKNSNFLYNEDFKKLFFNEIYYNFDHKYIDLNVKFLDNLGDIFYEEDNNFNLKINSKFDYVINNYFNNIFNSSNVFEFNNFYNFKSIPELDLININFESYYDFDINFEKNLNYNYKNKYIYVINSVNNFNIDKYIKNNFKINLKTINKEIFYDYDNFNENLEGYYNLDLNSFVEDKSNKNNYVFKTNSGDYLISSLKDNKLNNYLDKKIKSSVLDLNKKKFYKKKKNDFLDGLPTPKDFKTYLDKYIIGQDSAKKILSVAIYNHFKRLKFNLIYGYNLPKSNILLIGPSGSGKTYIMQTLSKILNIPFVIADATTLTEAGYVGEDVEGVIQRLFQESDFDIERTEMGIVYIDEIDKISKRTIDGAGGGRDVSGEGVQQALLKLVEGTICPVCFSNNRKNFNQNFVNINTENILFICGGAFFNLEKIISDRDEKINIGFSNNHNIKKKNNIIKKTLDSEDLVKFGLIPELIGRLPVIARLYELDVDILIKILKDPNSSIINYYNILLSPENIKLTIDDDAIEIIAEMAYKRKTGARGLRGIIDNILSDVLYEAPEIDTLREIIIHKYVFEGDCRTPLLVHYDLF